MSETITAVAGLWPLALVVVLAIGMLIFKRQIQALLERLSRFSMKRGETELVIEGKAEQAAVVMAELPAPATAEPPKPDESQKESPPASSEDTNVFGAMIDAIAEHRFDDAHTLFEKIQAEEKDSATKTKNEVFYLVLSYAHGHPDIETQRIEQIAEANPDLRAFALRWLAWGYRKVSALEQARDAASRSVDASQAANERVDNTILLAQIYQQTGDLDRAHSLLSNLLTETISSDSQVAVYRAIASIFKDRDDDLMRAIVLEKTTELKPTDTQLRFAAAYAQSEANLSHLSSANYEQTIKQGPETAQSSMNNLAVLADAFKLPIKAVSLYRASMERGETLASANLAYKLLNQGFTEEARDVLNAAKAKDDVHQNVHEALADASKRETAEADTWNKILKEAVAHRMFVRAFADARFKGDGASLPFNGKWKAPDGTTFEISEQADSEIVAEWGASDSTLGSLVGSSSRRKLEGRRVNRSIIGAIKKWEHSVFTNSGHYEYRGTPALAFVKADGARIEVMLQDKDNPVIMQFIRVPATTAVSA